MVCDFGQRINNAFMEISDEIDQFDWYLFSNKLQRILPVLIIGAKKSVGFKCFGSIGCDREAWKKVKFIRRVFSKCKSMIV